jgi:hypothetical protein
MGGGGIFVNLPAAWVRRAKVRAGDQVSIEADSEGALRISIAANA